MYRTNEEVLVGPYLGLLRSNLYLANLQYPFNRVRSIRTKIGVRLDRIIVKAEDDFSAKIEDAKRTFSQFNLEYDLALVGKTFVRLRKPGTFIMTEVPK